MSLPTRERRFRFMGGKTIRIFVGFNFAPMKEVRGQFHQLGQVRERNWLPDGSRASPIWLQEVTIVDGSIFFR